MQPVHRIYNAHLPCKEMVLLKDRGPWPHNLVPQRALTRFAHWYANAQFGWLTQWTIRRFVRKYQVDMSLAQEPDLAHYKSFNLFFTRALKLGARPIDARATWVSPVDGAISQLGPISGDLLFQAKGHRYSAQALLGGRADWAKCFENGDFATIYLSPKDYHRIHMPCAGVLRSMVYVPGSLFSVNPATARAVPGLFARNERVVCLFDTEHGPMAMVLVGATVVGSMQTVWHGIVNHTKRDQLQEWHYPPEQAMRLNKGDEMGRFLLGSTVILLWPAQTVQFDEACKPEAVVCLGQPLAQKSRWMPVD